MILLLQMFSFSVINNLDTPSPELQINFGMLQIDTENSATGNLINLGMTYNYNNNFAW